MPQASSRIRSVPHNSRHVIALDTEGRHCLMVPVAAIPLLSEFLPREDYRDPARRTLKRMATSGIL